MIVLSRKKHFIQKKGMGLFLRVGPFSRYYSITFINESSSSLYGTKNSFPTHHFGFQVSTIPSSHHRKPLSRLNITLKNSPASCFIISLLFYQMHLHHILLGMVVLYQWEVVLMPYIQVNNALVMIIIIHITKWLVSQLQEEFQFCLKCTVFQLG